MRLLIFKINTEGVTSFTHDDTEILLVDPSLIETDMMQELNKIDMVLVDKRVVHDEKIKSLKFGYQITDYSNGQLQKVVVL